MQRWHGHHVFDRIEADQGLPVIPPVTDLFVDTTNGSDTNAGTTWELALATIGAAMLLAAALASRGRCRIFVAPGGYNEDVVTPLNTECPFGQLIAWNPTPRKSYGAAYIYAATAGQPGLTVRARGWLIEGFEIAAIANAKAILLDGQSANCNPGGLILQHGIVTGWGAAGSIGIDVIGNGAPHTTLRDLFFDGFLANAIQCSESGTDQPRYWELDLCRFVDNANHINFSVGPRGMKESWVHDCAFMQVGANRNATKQLDNQGGNGTIIGPNNFLSGDYDEGNGGYYAGANEEWRGNHTQDGLTYANPTA